MTYTTLICETCKKEIPRKSQKQKYCLPCSIKKNRKPTPSNMKICLECNIEYNAYAFDQLYCTKLCRKKEYERKINAKWMIKTPQPKAYKKIYNSCPNLF